jgi:hypothetical protein
VLHQAWSDGSFFPVVNRSARTLVEDGATVVWTVEAASWVEAMSRYHEWRGWEPYRPMDSDPGAYSAAQEAEAAEMASRTAEPGPPADGGGTVAFRDS